MRKIIIDCDPGIDDAIAIMLAHSSPDIEILAITTCFGNTGCDVTTRNALDIAEGIGLDVPVARGADKPLFVAGRAFSNFHGENGVGGAKLPRARREAEPDHAWDLIYRLAKMHPGEITLVTQGPLTNLAIALFKYEDLPGCLAGVSMMGGSATVGNVTPHGEANVWSDPHACEAVFRSGLPVTMYGLDATEQTRLSEAEVDSVFGRESRLSSMLGPMINHYKSTQNRHQEAGMVIHDAAAMAGMVDSRLVRTEKFPVTVELASQSMLGRTVVDRRLHATAPRNVDVATWLDKNGYLALLEEMMRYYR